MKKKLVSMLLTVAMLLSLCALSMTGCSADKSQEEAADDLEEAQKKAASTLVLWIVTEDGTDPEQAEDVAKAMAEITKSKYSTDLKIRYLSEDEYYTKLEAAIAENERLADLKKLTDAVAKQTKKGNSEMTGQFKKGEITEDQKDDLFFTYLVDAMKVISSVLAGNNSDYEHLTMSDEEVEEFLIDIVGQLVGYDVADALVNNRETLIATMKSELANPPAASEVKKTYIYMTQETIDLTERLFDLIVEHKDSFADDANKDKDDEAKKDEADDDEIQRDEDGNMIVDKTIYPEAEDYQVDIIYLSGHDKYVEYIDNGWIMALDTELSGNSKTISSYVSTSLLNAVKHEGSTYAIPNNNVIGEYTYMLIDKELFDKYYYTGTVDQVHSIVDVSSFIEDIANHEPDVLPINGDAAYCMSLIAHYWSIDPTTFTVDSSSFSVLGHAYAADEVVSRGSTVMTFDNLLANETYKESLMNLKAYEYAGYFGTPAEGQKSAISFVTGDASLVEEYEDDNYVVVVDYPKVSDDDVYGNMFAVSTFSVNSTRSMQVVTLLNTDEEFRNLFQYGIEGLNYTLNSDGSVSETHSNAYHMDRAKTGNEFIVYLPEGSNLEVWKYAKQQNRESQVDPLLGFNFKSELSSEEEDALAADADKTFYYVETLDTALIKHIADLSTKAWAAIQACTDIDSLESTITTWATTISKDAKVKQAMSYDIVEPTLDEKTGEVVTDEDDDSSSKTPTVSTTITKTMIRKVEQYLAATDETIVSEVKYFLITKTYNPYQIYFRWMSEYQFVPAGFVTSAE